MLLALKTEERIKEYEDVTPDAEKDKKAGCPLEPPEEVQPELWCKYSEMNSEFWASRAIKYILKSMYIT